MNTPCDLTYDADGYPSCSCCSVPWCTDALDHCSECPRGAALRQEERESREYDEAARV